MSKILIVDDEPKTTDFLADLLKSEGFQPVKAYGGKPALKILEQETPDLVILDLLMPDLDGLEVLKKIRQKYPDLPVVILTASAKVESVVLAMKLGADDYLTKEEVQDKLLITVRNHLKTHGLARQVNDLKAQLKEWQKPDLMIGQSRPMKEIFELIEKAAGSEITVLIFGESGTGKELVARAIHAGSRRADKPLITIDCASLPETLVESELFGYEKGAFTGANSRKHGKFELAQGGTLFLDEIGNLSPNAQQKLLRVLEEMVIERLGGNEPIKVNVRLITATNVRLTEAVKNKSFREDLYYRLNVFSLFLPPLRDRTGDLPLLAEYFIKKFCSEQHKPFVKISDEAAEVLGQYAWPGNVRELRNIVERAVLLADNLILPKHLPLEAMSQEKISQDTAASEGESLKAVSKTASARAEKTAIISTLESVRGNKAEAARKLKIDYKTLYNKIKEYGIE